MNVLQSPESEGAPESLYMLAASLISNNIIELPDLIPHLKYV